MESIKPLLDLVTGFGTAAPAIGLILWLYWQERTERRELFTQLMKLTVDTIEAEKEMTTALNVLSAKVSPK
jgi:hypothetical protein